MANWRKRDGVLALSAVITLLAAELLCFGSGIPKWPELEMICNIVMFAIAIAGFFFLGRPAENERISFVLGNMAVSLTAIIMNIDVFEHVIRLEHLMDDLWGWHSLWGVCAILQILILSPLGKLLLKQFQEILQWGKEMVVTLGGIFLETAKQVKKSNGRIRLIVIGGILSWAGYLGIQIFYTDVYTVFSGKDFFGKSLLCWIIYLIITVLIYLLSTVQQKSAEALQTMDAKKVLIGIAVIIVCVGAVLILPLILKMISMAIMLIGLLSTAVKQAGKEDMETFTPMDKGQAPPSSRISIRRMDVAVLLIFVVVIPLATVFFITLTTPAGGELFSENISDPTAWLEFGSAFLDVMNGLLDLFGLR